jgi:6-phosphogluconolactonase (cycloisomerase 2 family)
VPTGSNGAEAIALDPAGRRLCVANINTDEPGSVTMFAVGASGGIQRLGRPIQTGGRQPDFGGVVIG